MPGIRLMLKIHVNDEGRTRTFAELVKDLRDDGLVPVPGMAIEDEEPADISGNAFAAGISALGLTVTARGSRSAGGSGR